MAAHWGALLVLRVGLPLLQPGLAGPEAEAFLREADVVGSDDIPIGVTRPDRLELTDGTVTLRASWKTLDEMKRGITRLADGTAEANFTDSFKYDVAAYELDKLLGLGIVPPTVERRIKGDRGAVVLWIENAMTDFDRRQKNLSAPDMVRWNQQYSTLMLFRNLIYDIDYKNARNNLIDAEWRLWAIDSTRAFRTKKELLPDYPVDMYSRAVLARLEALDLDMLKEHLGDWIGEDRMKALLDRRDLLLKRAADLVAERGEAAVLFP